MNREVVCDEVLADAARRSHAPERILGALLKADVADRKARLIKCQLSVARFADGFDFVQSLVEKRLLCQLADGSLLDSPLSTDTFRFDGTSAASGPDLRCPEAWIRRHRAISPARAARSLRKWQVLHFGAVPGSEKSFDESLQIPPFKSTCRRTGPAEGRTGVRA